MVPFTTFGMSLKALALLEQDNINGEWTELVTPLGFEVRRETESVPRSVLSGCSVKEVGTYLPQVLVLLKQNESGLVCLHTAELQRIGR